MFHDDDRRVLVEILEVLIRLEQLMTANDDALAALQAAVTANTTATDAAVAALGTASGGSDDISAGVNAAATTVEANTTALTNATTPPVTTTTLSFAASGPVTTAVGQPASFSLGSISGGTAPYTVSVTGLPSALVDDSQGNVSGVPAAAGTATLEVSVTDSSTPPETATGSVSLTVQ